MNAKDIKPIPQRIEKRIRALDKQRCPEQKGLRFYAYLTTIKKELVKITVAMRNKGKKEQLIKQVAVHGVYSDKCLVRDLAYCYLGIYAYRVGWYDEGIKYRYGIRPYYNDGKWHSVDFKYYNPYAEVVNLNLALKLFPYCALDYFSPACPIVYLRTYIQFPQAEFLVKFGLSRYATSKQILRKTAIDKRFRKWLVLHKDELKSNAYYVGTILLAYKTNQPLPLIQELEETKKSFYHEYNNNFIKRYIPKSEYDKFCRYITKQKTDLNCYDDYLRACLYLNVDINVEKNRYPHDFMRWHDIRVDEYITAKALEDERKRKELYAKFAAVADKYKPLQTNGNGVFAVFIAHSPSDLIREGDCLHHCVGHMGYDQKFIREESLIFFIRNVSEPDIPFVTLEYSVKSKKILQCYADKNTKPNEKVLEFINKKWLPFANKQMKKIAA